MSPRPHLPPAIVAAEDAPAFWRVGILWNVVLSADTTSGQFTMMDQTMPRGSGAPPHIHERYDEGFFIIDGAIEYTVGDGGDQQTTLAEPGAAVWIPRGTRHTFTVKTDTSGALNFYTPGGFDESISLLATPASARTLPPPESGEQDPHGFQTDPEKEQEYLARIANLHSQSMP
jgi:quercetin dioxygenase-like cupin family protein